MISGSAHSCRLHRHTRRRGRPTPHVRSRRWYLCLRIGRVVVVCAWFEPHGKAPGPGVCVCVGYNTYTKLTQNSRRYTRTRRSRRGYPTYVLCGNQDKRAGAVAGAPRRPLAPAHRASGSRQLSGGACVVGLLRWLCWYLPPYVHV